MELFCERVKRLREQRSLTVRSLAMLTGVTHASIVRIENGETKPRMDSLAAMARALNVTSDYLLTGRESPHVAVLHRAIMASPHRDERLVALVRAAHGDDPS